MKKHIKKRLNRTVGGDLTLFLFLLVGGLFMVLPLVFAIVTSFKPFNELWIFPPRFYVVNPTVKNYVDLFNIMSNSTIPFTRYIFNSIFVTGVGTFGQIILASMCAYPLAKREFPGKNLMFSMVVMALMFNTVVTSVPSYMIMSTIGWIDTLKAIVVPAFGSSLGLYLMKQFMEGVPGSIIEAAKIDGASEWRIFWRIVMPQVKPAWLTLMLFSVQSLWNMPPSTYIYTEKLKTLTYAMSQLTTAGLARAGVGAAISVVMMAVPVTIFLITQSNVIETMATSGMKD